MTLPLADWLEKEIGERFPDDEILPSGQLRVRVARLCFDLLDLIEARQKIKNEKLREQVLSLRTSVADLAEELRR